MNWWPRFRAEALRLLRSERSGWVLGGDVGKDGDMVLTNDLHLTRAMYYRSLDLNGYCIETHGHPIYVAEFMRWRAPLWVRLCRRAFLGIREGPGSIISNR